jgi:hypothetical protein
LHISAATIEEKGSYHKASLEMLAACIPEARISTVLISLDSEQPLMLTEPSCVVLVLE